MAARRVERDGDPLGQPAGEEAALPARGVGEVALLHVAEGGQAGGEAPHPVRREEREVLLAGQRELAVGVDECLHVVGPERDAEQAPQRRLAPEHPGLRQRHREEGEAVSERPRMHDQLPAPGVPSNGIASSPPPTVEVPQAALRQEVGEGWRGAGRGRRGREVHGERLRPGPGGLGRRRVGEIHGRSSGAFRYSASGAGSTGREVGALRDRRGGRRLGPRRVHGGPAPPGWTTNGLTRSSASASRDRGQVTSAEPLAVQAERLAAGGTAHRQLAVMAGGGDHERPELDADEAGEMHAPTSVAAGHHRCEGVECHGGMPLRQDEHGPLGAGGGIPDPEGAVGAGGDDPGAVRAHRTAVHRAGVAGRGWPVRCRWRRPRS